MSEWQPIKTAPLEIPVLVYLPLDVRSVCIGIKRKGWNWATVPGLYSIKPTQWMPVPEPPDAR